MWGKKAIEAYNFHKEATGFSILKFFPKGPKTTNNDANIIVSFYPVYMSPRLRRIEKFDHYPPLPCKIPKGCIHPRDSQTKQSTYFLLARLVP